MHHSCDWREWIAHGQPESLWEQLLSSEWISIRTEASLRVYLLFLHWFGDTPRCTQHSLQHSNVFLNSSQSLPWYSCTSNQRSQLLMYQLSEIPFSPVLVIRDPSYSEGQLECPPRVWYSPQIDTSKFTLHILSDTSGGSQGPRYSLLMNVYHLWQPDEFHQLLMDLVKDWLHWLLKYRKARNVKDHFNNRFTLELWYPGLQPFSKPSDLVKSSSWQGKEIRGMIRTLALNCTPLLDHPRMKGKPWWKEPQMKWQWVQCGHYANSIYLLANKVTLIYPPQHVMMHWSNFKWTRRDFKNRKCRCLQMPQWMICCHENPISYENKDL